MLLPRPFSPSTLLRIAMACLLVSTILPRIVHPTTTAGADWLDGLRGLMIGLMVGFTFLFFKARNRSASR